MVLRQYYHTASTMQFFPLIQLREVIIHTYPHTLSDHTMLLIQLKWDVVSQDNRHVLPLAFINIHTLLKKE